MKTLPNKCVREFQATGCLQNIFHPFPQSFNRTKKPKRKYQRNHLSIFPYNSYAIVKWEVSRPHSYVWFRMRSCEKLGDETLVRNM